MSKELEATEARQALRRIERSVGEHGWFGWEEVNTLEAAIDELECSRHNYNALKEFYNNAVAYGAKIQAELNELKKQEKLLELYREKDKYIKVFTPLPKVELDKYRNIVKQIKELENE